MTTRTTCMFLALGWVAAGNPAQAQLVAVDDTYSVPYNASRVVEPPGLLENDTWHGDPVTDHGGTAALLVYPNHGILNCAADPTFALCPNGSFTYTPDPSFPGFDSFVYQVDVGGQLGQATVTLSACRPNLPLHHKHPPCTDLCPARCRQSHCARNRQPRLHDANVRTMPQY